MTTSYTLTGDLASILGGAVRPPRIIRATIGTNLGDVALVDLDANQVRMSGPVRLELNDDLTFSISLIATNSTGTNIPSGTLRYVVNVEYADVGSQTTYSWSSGYFELTTARDLSDVVGSDVAIPVTPLPSPALIDPATAANVNDTDSQTRTALNALYARRRKYDVRDYLAADDFGAAVNRAIAAAGADAHVYGKPGQVVMPPGNFAVTTQINWHQGASRWYGVDLIGCGWGKTVLRPQGTIAAIRYDSTGGSESLRDVMVANFEIDGSEQAGAYSTGIKGLYMVGLRRVTVDHLYIHDTGATGLGNDYHDECTIRDVLAKGCGRLNSGSDPGGAGIGIGTGGYWVTENLVVDGCSTHSNERAGLFFETQTGVLSEGARVINHAASYNGDHGIGDAGCRGLVVQGGLSHHNGLAGFGTYDATVVNAVPGIAGRVTGLTCHDNTHGVHIDWSGRRPGAGFTAYDPITETQQTITPNQLGYTIEGCHIRNNTEYGALIEPGDAAGEDVPDVSILGNDIHHNGRSGVAASGVGVASGGVVNRATIAANRISSNGTSGTNRQGIRIGVPMVDAHIRGNRVWDDGVGDQQYGIILDTSITLSGNSVVDGNDLRGNATGTIALNGTVSSPAIIRDNPGYNPSSTVTNLTVTASPFTHTAGSSPLDVYIKGGTVSDVSKGADSVYSATGCMVHLNPYQSVTVTYSAAPTVKTARV